MKVLTQITNVKSQPQHNNNNNVIKSSLSNTLTKTQSGEQAAVNNNTKESPEMKYLHENSCNNNKYNMKSLETPKQYNSNNKNGGKKPNSSHTYYNIPTTTNVSNRKKYYQQHHHRYNQQQHNNNFLNNNKDNKYKYTTTKNNSKLETANTCSIDICSNNCEQNQKLSKVSNATSLKNVEDLVNNNNITTLDANTISNTNLNGGLDFIVDKSVVALSSPHRAKTAELKHHYIPTPLTPTIVGESLKLTSDTLPKHNCLGENSNINLDCNSCWTHLVTPQSIDQLQATWSWTTTHVSRYKRSSVSSTASSTHSSTASASISNLADRNSEALHNTTSGNECASNTNKNKSRNTNFFRKGNTSSSRSSSAELNRCSSPKLEEQLQRVPSNISPTTDGIQNIKYSSVVSASEVSIITETPSNIHLAENSKAKKTAMTTALTSTVSTTAATTSTTNNSTATKTTIVADNVITSSGRSTNLATTSSLSSSTIKANEIDLGEEFSTLPVTPTTATSLSISNSKTTSASSSTTVSLATSAGSPTATVSSNSYSLDFLHSVGEQMTGGANLVAFSKSSITTMRPTTTTFNNENPTLGSPARNSYSAYQNVGPNRQHTMPNRYMPNSSAVGIVNDNNNNNNTIHTREQRGHRFQQHHHHHQPHPLTLGAFMQKELMNENFISGSGSSGNSRGINSGNNNLNGSGDSGMLDVNNNNNNNNGDYTNHQSYRNHQRYHNYYQSHHYHHQTHQQRLLPMQHGGYTNAQSSYHNEMASDGVTRIIRNGSSTSNHTQQQQHSKHHIYQSQQQQNNVDATLNISYQSQHNSLIQEDDSSGEVGSNEILSDINRNINAASNNFRSTKQQQKLPITKKSSNYVSSSTSSCSTSSTSSASSNCSQASTSYRQQKMKSTSQMNLVIETLPRKHHNNNSASTYRNHRLHQSHNYQNQQHHSLQQQQFSTAATCALHASTAQQLHQNIHNLTYVNTENLTNVGAHNTTVQTRSCSPILPPPSSSSTPGPHSASSQDTSTTSMIHPYTTSNQFYSRPQQHQQNYMHDNKRLVAPFALNVCSTHATATQSTSPITVGNIICYTQLNDSSASFDSSQSTNITHGHTTISHDYDDSDSSSTNSVAQQRINHQQSTNSVSLSSSSSTSSISSTTAVRNYNVPQQQQQEGMTTMALAHIQSHDHTDFAAYNAGFASTSHHYSAQAQLASPQQQQQQQPTHFRNNGIISMFNVSLSNNNCTDDELNSMKQSSIKHQGIHHQQRHFYFTSGEHLNAHVANGGYWSPVQHSSFLYPQPPTNFMAATAPCTTPTATLSPCLSDHDDHQHHLHPLHNQQSINVANNQSEAIPSVSHLKRSSTPQMPTTTMAQQQQLQHHRLSQSTVASTTAAVASLRQRGGNRSQQPQVAAPPPPPSPTPSISHVYTQHNLLFGGSQTHLRSSVNASHEFFTHTPPDRFLARAHLIEAKETPTTLLNNSKWDNLSQGIWNKFINSQQTEDTFKQKMRLWRYLYIIIKNTYPRFGLYLVGSTISGFGADTSDVDMCLVSRSASTVEPRMEALINLTVLRDYLCKSAEFENFNLIEAKVPILRFRDRVHQLEVDLNFNNCVGIKNTHLLYCYSQLDWRLRPLVLVTKLWAQYHNINNAKNMTISSYSLVLMVIHFLQYAVSPAVLPCLHDVFPDKFPLLRSNDFGFVDMNETMSPYESKNIQTIGELFLSFLEYYSCFDYTQFAISIRTGGLLPINICRLAKSLKNDIHQWKELCIEEPFDLTNTARSVYDFDTFERVKAVFVASWRILQQTLDLNTIFAPIMVPPTSGAHPTLSTGVQYGEPNSKASSETLINRENTMQLTKNGSIVVISQDTNTQATMPINTEENDKDNKITCNTKGESLTASGSLPELVS